MKHSIIKATFLMAAGAIFMTACEKEDTDLAMNNNANSTTKSNSFNAKSGDEFPSGYWDGVQVFIHNIMEEESPGDMEIEQALYYTEAALDWQLANVDQNNFKYRKMGDQLTFDVNGLSSVGSDYEIIATDLTNLNSEIKDAIEDQATDLAIENGDTVYIQSIDLTWALDGGGNVEVFADVLYGFGPGIGPSPTCNFNYRYAGVRQACNSVNTSTNGHEMIDAFTSPLTGCGTWRDKLTCSLGNHMILNTRSSKLSGVSGCGFTLFSGAVSYCMTPVTNNGIRGLEEHHNEAQSAWNSYCSSITNINSKLRTVLYRGEYSTTIPVTVDYEAIYRTAKCRITGFDPGDPPISRPCCRIYTPFP